MLLFLILLVLVFAVAVFVCLGLVFCFISPRAGEQHALRNLFPTQ